MDQATAISTNLTYAGDSSAFLRADSTDTNAKNGRNSVRITSKKQFHSGLFVFDIKHTPYGCGTWPAVWLADPSDWPGNGEIDVVETVNQGNTGNQMALHTSKGCKMNARRAQTGTVHGTCIRIQGQQPSSGVSNPVSSVPNRYRNTEFCSKLDGGH